MSRLASLAALICTSLICAGLVYLAIEPRHPLPDRWNPAASFDPAAAPTLVTRWQLDRTLANPGLCRAALARGGAFAPAIDDRSPEPGCGLSDAVALRRLGEVGLTPVHVPCALALRLLLWERYDLQPAASTLLGSPVAEIAHYGAYSCRAVRTIAGAGRRMSLHATGEAIDIAGVRLADGRTVTLAGDWDGSGPEAEFLRAMQDSLCRRFRQVLGPDYNALHADHFHVAIRGGAVCR